MIVFLQFLSLFTLLSQAFCAEFFPFGSAYGDTTVPVADDNFVQVSISPLRLCNRRYHKLFVNSNGVISFDVGVWSYQPEGFPTNVFRGIAPFWAGKVF